MTNSIAVHNLLTALNYQGNVVATVGLSAITLSDGSKLSLSDSGVKVTYAGGGITYHNSRKVFALMLNILSDKNHQINNIKELLIAAIHAAVLPIYDSVDVSDIKYAIYKDTKRIAVRMGEEIDFTNVVIDLDKGTIHYRETSTDEFVTHVFEYLEYLPEFKDYLGEIENLLIQVGAIKLFVA